MNKGIIDSLNANELIEDIRWGRLDQLNKWMTAEQLAGARTDTGWTALHEMADRCWLDRVQGGATAEQLAAVCDQDGWTALHTAAKRGCLTHRFRVVPPQIN